MNLQIAAVQALLDRLTANPCPQTRGEASANLIIAIQEMADENSMLGDLYLKNMLESTLIHIRLLKRHMSQRAEAN